MPHFFISYAKKDTRELALALSDALNQLDTVTAWVDRSLRAGASWELQIQSEIDKCDYFIVLYSPDINRHKQGDSPSYVLKEISYTLYTAKKPVIPVMAQKTDPPFSLNDIHYIDFTISGVSLSELIEAICVEANLEFSSNAVVSNARQIGSQDILFQVKSLLPSPFDWCEVPAGSVRLVTDIAWKENYIPKGDKGITFDTHKFYMSKYPISNAQFAKFIEAGGYKNKTYWTETGWEIRKKEQWREPFYWNDVLWNGASYPVVGVSWYEANAFCNWLNDSFQISSGIGFRLPSEHEWQRAAQGDDERLYPWGNDFDINRANVKGNEINKTTPIISYPMGTSPFGLFDMAGNVWEWCLTDYETGRIEQTTTSAKVLRGGAWDFTGNYARTNYRYLNRPNLRAKNIGFRIVCHLQ